MIMHWAVTLQAGGRDWQIDRAGFFFFLSVESAEAQHFDF